ncbi:MAG: type IV secretory system conjugative DNA transfer family protein, partial [Mycolicibacterium sp.]|nr:type IV secretory system conjugative DNA transfer family protein [Mycolicibacterium sp.]
MPVETPPHIGCFATSGIGKTKGWLAQAAALWPAPALVSSSKDDIWQLVSTRRYSAARNNFMVDLRSLDLPEIPAIIRCQYDPTRLIDRFDDAKHLAQVLLSVSGVALKGGYRSTSNSDTWDKLAMAPLACLLWAASRECTNGGMSWVLAAAENVEVPRDRAGNAIYNRSGVSWAAASCWAPEAIFSLRTRRVLEYNPKMRDSVALAITDVLTPWLLTYERSAGLPYLTTSWLADNSATVYLLSTDDGTTAGQAVTLIDHLITVQRQKTAKGEDRPRLG